jgi:hypothetical protein
MGENATTTGQRKTELRKAVLELTERGLYVAAKWAAEQLAGVLIPHGLAADLCHRCRQTKVHAVMACVEDPVLLPRINKMLLDH